MTFCLFLFYILFPNNLVTNIVFPGKQGIYLENGILSPFLFYKLGKFFLQVSWTVSNNVLSLWLICGCHSFVRAIRCRVLVTWCRLWYFPLINQHLLRVCGTCRSGSAVGHDNISMNLIKDSIDEIIFPITSIINLSITSGIVPNQLKIARVIPLFKSGEQDIFTNYRPVSVLPAFSKILERVMYNRLLRFFNAFKILYDNQYGFRKHHSTAYALACLYDKIWQ